VLAAAAVLAVYWMVAKRQPLSTVIRHQTSGRHQIPVLAVISHQALVTG